MHLDDASVRVLTKLGQAKPHHLAPGLTIRLPAQIEAGPGESVGPYSLTLTIDMVNGRIGCTSLTVRPEEGKTITGTDLRAIPVATIVRMATATLVHETTGGGEGYVTVTPYTPPEINVRAGATDEALRFVAASYSLAYALGEPPAKAVERDLGIATSTASKWIRLAREKGYLDIPAGQARKA